jgi:hypothetical protein
MRPETAAEADIKARWFAGLLGLVFLWRVLEALVDRNGFLGVVLALALTAAVTLVAWRIGYLALCKIWGLRRDTD